MKTGEPWAVKLRDQRSIGDFRKWKDHDAYQQAFNRILRDLKTMPDDAQRFRAAAHKTVTPAGSIVGEHEKAASSAGAAVASRVCPTHRRLLSTEGK